EKKLLKIAVVRLPYISNFTDLESFARLPFVGVEFFDSADSFDMDADLLVIPGSKNSVKSMEFLDDSGISDKIRSFAVGKPVVGVCGGFQLLGEILDDSAGNEDSSAKKVRGLSLLPTRTFFDSKKIRVLVSENLPPLDGFFSFLSGKKACGYEIHQGSTSVARNGGSLRILSKGNVLGTYIHGFFDSSEIVSSILCALAKKRGVEIPPFGDFRTEKDAEFDRLERTVRGSVDVEKLYEIMGIDRKV
ncbi:MAG: cobyric acid synthase CobQ, partial [Treponema sp.]|nr:cobyric acid synthase CobQ [Treponema sp.]